MKQTSIYTFEISSLRSKLLSLPAAGSRPEFAGVREPQSLEAHVERVGGRWQMQRATFLKEKYNFKWELLEVSDTVQQEK